MVSLAVLDGISIALRLPNFSDRLIFEFMRRLSHLERLKFTTHERGYLINRLSY